MSSVAASETYYEKALPIGKMGIWWFLASEIMVFGGLIGAYILYRMASAGAWAEMAHHVSTTIGAINTVVLLTSSLTMVLAVRAAKLGRRPAIVKWLLATALGGVIFDILHIHEWMGLIDEGVRLFHNPWGSPLFGASFFSLTGLHMTHVTIGVVYLAVVAIGIARGKYNSEDVEVSGLYWHFVDLVWMFIFPLVYLMSAKTA